MSQEMERREFLRWAGIAAVAPAARGQGRRVAIEVPDGDAIAGKARWAAEELRRALAERGVAASFGTAARGGVRVVAAGRGFGGVTAPQAPGALALGMTNDAVAACGSDARGLSYALLELADRVRFATDPMAALAIGKTTAEQPANTVRSVTRLFVSDVEDKPWFNDRDMWPAYLTMLASQRFNRFSLAMGIGYDFLRQVTDAYFLFAYPFLLSVPGYQVRAVGLDDAERDRNLSMLKYISDEAAARGLEFQLGLWTHGYQWTDSPKANYTIEGLTAENHAAYSRDALTALLRACPGITGVTFRIHGESGVAEGSYGFWRTVFEGVARCGRRVEIDMHSKGIDARMIDVGLATGMPVMVSPKFWAEHMGLTYHQTAIREQEMPRAGRNDQGFFALSSGSRSFTRYGYADLLREDRRYGVVHRIWPGTQRLLLWGDPSAAAVYSRAFQFCGSAGVEICEPLSFKGRRGSGIAGDRCAYADPSLRTRWDWEKYLYSYRVWGRLLYNPDAEPDTWRRYLRAPAAEAALAEASRILPLITTAHCPSAANNNYWPEMYTNQPIVDAGGRHPYSDTPSPKTFGNVSPLDPQLFLRINDFAEELLKRERSGKYSPAEVARWLDGFADTAARNVTRIQASTPELRRLVIDVDLQAGLGRFFSGKLRAGVLYAIYERTGERNALEEALKAYRGARAAWAQLAERAKGVYVADVTVGELPWLRGHWLDRLPAIDGDIADMAKRLESAKPASDERVRTAIAEVLAPPPRATPSCRHTPPATFRPSQALAIEIATGGTPEAVRMYYRHVNQAERFQVVPMTAVDQIWHAAIPGAYTDSPFPLQYYFEVVDAPDKVFLYPANLAAQPYYVVRRKA